CDWTEQTETKYFNLLSHLKQKLNRQTILSATIRLHQIKYRNRTGVPPVSRGALMFYNLNHPGTPGVKNAILDLDVGRQYLDHLQEYPLPLDVALPVYSWGVLFQGKNYLGLINNLTKKELQQDPNFLYNKQSDLFTAKQNTYILQTHIYKNDQLRIDEIPYQELIKTSKYLAKRLRTHKLTVTLFHLDAKLLGRFTDEELQNVFHAFD
ncbi:MAG TPA: hypothetical protein VEC37_01465, partial [Bacillota bacterium]|nr:hypothetical protein [Bacillota bacterium]